MSQYLLPLCFLQCVLSSERYRFSTKRGIGLLGCSSSFFSLSKLLVFMVTNEANNCRCIKSILNNREKIISNLLQHRAVSNCTVCSSQILTNHYRPHNGGMHVCRSNCCMCCWREVKKRGSTSFWVKTLFINIQLRKCKPQKSGDWTQNTTVRYIHSGTQWRSWCINKGFRGKKINLVKKVDNMEHCFVLVKFVHMLFVACSFTFCITSFSMNARYLSQYRHRGTVFSNTWKF